MPKKKQKRKPSSAAYVAQTERTTSQLKARVIKWASISVILAILLSLMIAAISASPSQAATASPTVCAPIDTDGDAITNDVDSDIDGDGTVNGLDDDIDGDKILNVNDTDPAATNCGADAPVPAFNNESDDDDEGNLLVRLVAVVTVSALGIGYILLRRVRRNKK